MTNTIDQKEPHLWTSSETLSNCDINISYSDSRSRDSRRGRAGRRKKNPSHGEGRGRNMGRRMIRSEMREVEEKSIWLFVAAAQEGDYSLEHWNTGTLGSNNRQHCRLTICWHFCWVWPILIQKQIQITSWWWDKQACLIKKVGAKQTCLIWVFRIEMFFNWISTLYQQIISKNPKLMINHFPNFCQFFMVSASVFGDFQWFSRFQQLD